VRYDYRASESGIGDIPPRLIIRAMLRIILWLHNNPTATPTPAQLFTKFKELVR